MDVETGNLLVVDDNEMNRDLLSRRLRKKGHRVEVAEGGRTALEMIDGDEFDLVLLDIMMPGMDGFEVLTRIREDRDASDLPVIMATAKTESEDVVAALKIGANDYVTKPFDFPVVLARVNTQIALKKGREALARAHRRMKHDLEAAASIQQTLLPVEKPEIAGARCAWRYVPCDELAGDTLNIVPLGDGITGLYVLDVSGHGVPSSLLSVILSKMFSGAHDASSVLRSRVTGSDELCVASPLEVANELVRQFPYNDETHQYFTMVYGTLDAENRLFSYISAGHPPIVHIRRGSEPVFHPSTGSPIALVPDFLGPNKFSELKVELEPGDRFYLYSDGIPEAMNSVQEEFEGERIAEALQGCLDKDLDESIDALLQEVWAWGGGHGPNDDVSILAVEIEG